MVRFVAPAADAITAGPLTGEDWLRAGVIVVATLVVATAAHRIARRALSRWLRTGFGALMGARLVGYVAFLLGLFYALDTLGVQVGPLLGALGLGGLVVALALQKVVENFVAGIVLQTRRPFTLGDTIRIGDEVGTVADIDSRTTVLNGLDGTVIRIPNGTVIGEIITNLTRQARRRSSLLVGVAYDTDLELATEALRRTAALVPGIAATPPPTALLTTFGGSSIDITVYYWHASDVPSELAARHELMLAIHKDFDARGISIAFPQMVVWQQPDVASPIYPADGAH